MGRPVIRTGPEVVSLELRPSASDTLASLCRKTMKMAIVTGENDGRGCQFRAIQAPRLLNNARRLLKNNVNEPVNVAW